MMGGSGRGCPSLCMNMECALWKDFLCIWVSSQPSWPRQPAVTVGSGLFLLPPSLLFLPTWQNFTWKGTSCTAFPMRSAPCSTSRPLICPGTSSTTSLSSSPPCLHWRTSIWKRMRLWVSGPSPWPCPSSLCRACPELPCLS